VSNEHYFQVRINEMFLAAGRKWFVDYHPMVFVVSQFNYGFGANSKTEVRSLSAHRCWKNTKCRYQEAPSSPIRK
jgi:hypothetical protein